MTPDEQALIKMLTAQLAEARAERDKYREGLKEVSLKMTRLIQLIEGDGR